MTLEGREGRGGSGEGKEWERNGGRIVSAVVKKPVQQREVFFGLNKKLVIVISQSGQKRKRGVWFKDKKMK